MTSRRPFFPLYIADYLADTMHLSTLQHGIYIRLLLHYWQHGGLPTQHSQLARIARISPWQWRSHRKVIGLFFDHSWKQKRVEIELAKAAKISQVRKSAADKKHVLRRATLDANAGANGGAKFDANAHTLHTSLSTLNNFSTAGPRARAAAREATKPHHLAMDGKGHVYIEQGTEDWQAYAADYRAHRGAEPSANSHGGRWFNISGEATK